MVCSGYKEEEREVGCGEYFWYRVFEWKIEEIC